MAFAAENKPLFGKGMFTIDPNSTPEQIATKRALMQALMPRFGSAKYVGEGLGQLATGVVMGARGRKLDKIEGDNRAKADAMFSGILGGAMQGPMNILGVDPEYGQDANAPEQIGSDAMAALGKPQNGGYRESLIGTESGGNWSAKNNETGAGGKRGHFGRVQFGHARFEEAKRGAGLPEGMTPEQFMADPAAQMAAEDWHFADLEQKLSPYVGAVVNGQPLDMGALVAMGHLGGAAGAKKYVETGGRYNPADSFGTSLSDYAQKHGGNSASNTAMPQIPMDQMMALMANPWLAPEQRSMLETMMGQQMQAGDPMRQVELQKAQFELDRLRNPPPPAPPEEYTSRIFMAQQAGLEPGSPEFQNYLLTGELPAPAEQGYRTMTPEEVQTLGLPPGAYQQGPKGEIKPIGGGGVNVTNVLPGGEPDDGALRKKLSEKEGEAWSAYMDSGTISSGTMQDMQLLDELITMAPQGPISGRIAGAFPGVNSAADAFTSVVKRVAPTLRAPGSGATSDIEYEGMLKSLPQLSSRPEANAAISGMMKAKAQINVERGQIVSRYQNGEMSAADARASINELNNRSIISPELKSLIDGLAPAAAGTAPDGIDQADWDAMTPEGRALWD